MTELADIVTSLLRRAPEWVRSDLCSRDPPLRARAEDALAMMIAAALEDVVLLKSESDI
jgi:hypothetical protein